ncbi:MAG: hypothetical protein ACI3XA_09925 [Clostridia bacterium]
MYNCEDLKERLWDLGFEVPENHEDKLIVSMQRAESTIMNTCNCETVPQELRFVFLDLAAGEYLLAVRSCENDGEDDIASITEGDMSVSFRDRTETESLIDELLNGGREEMLSFRRVKW